MSPLLGVIDVLGFWNPSVFRVPSTLRAGALRARLGLTVLVALVDDLEDGLCRAFITQNRVSGRLSEGAFHEEAPLCFGLGLSMFLLMPLIVRQCISGTL